MIVVSSKLKKLLLQRYLMKNGYYILSNNENVITYRKMIRGESLTNIACYFIDVFYSKEHEDERPTDMMFTIKFWDYEEREYMYYIADDEETIEYIKEYDKGLLRYLRKEEG